MRERLLLFIAIAGFVVPNAFVVAFLVDEGFEIGGYFSLWTASIPSTQLLVDLAIASLAFFVWAAFDGPRSGVDRWWVCFPATLLVGLCFGLPLYLWMRERALRQVGSIGSPEKGGGPILSHMLQGTLEVQGR